MTQNELIKHLDDLCPKNTMEVILEGIKTETTKRNGITEWTRKQPVIVVKVCKRNRFYYQIITETCTIESDIQFHRKDIEHRREFTTPTGDRMLQFVEFTPLEDMPE